MLTSAEFHKWCVELGLTEQTRKLIEHIRASDPTRRVRSAAGNVSGFYPSRKMGCTIQFESHRNELAFIIEMEYDPEVFEIWDQPPSINLIYKSRSGKNINVLHTPDYFVIRRGAAGWIECKTEEELIKLEARQPNRFRYDKTIGKWRCQPGEEYALAFNLNYSIQSSREINWVYQRNVLFLEDFLRGEIPALSAEALARLRAIVASQPGVSLAKLLDDIGQYEILADSLYIAIVTSQLYVDLHKSVLAQPADVTVHLDPISARISKESYTSVQKQNEFIPGGELLNWDGKLWEVVHNGELHIWLRDEKGSVIYLTQSIISDLIGNNVIKLVPSPVDDALCSAKELLAAASPQDLAEANRRYELLSRKLVNGSKEELDVNKRTLRRWESRYSKAEQLYQCGFVGLLPSIRMRGNRAQKLPLATLTLMDGYIAGYYENVRQPTRFSVWSKLCKECETNGLPSPAYKTFCQKINRRSSKEQTQKRKGSKAAYQLEEFYYDLDQKTPKHGDRPFEIAHLDHTELDIELVCSQTGRNLGRPWATILTDAYSRRILAVYLSFDPPSYRSSMMTFRECVHRYRRMPQTLVIDGGREFHSVYFDSLLARYECVKKTRPYSQARFGSVCERLFGSTNTRFIYNLFGNTQMTKGDFRLITKDVNPKRLAVWTFSKLEEKLREWAYEVYDKLDHPALGQTPREAFEVAQYRAGHRMHRLIHNLDEFEILTLPSTKRGVARVIPGKGLKINYIFYWCEAFRDGQLEKKEIPVRYDPFDLGKAYAYVYKSWQMCHSEHYLKFQDRTERELMIAAAELRRRNQKHNKGLSVTAYQLACFLSSVEAEELMLQQRLRDREARKSRDSQPVLVVSDKSNPETKTSNQVTKTAEKKMNETRETLIRIYDPSELDVYEEYK